MSHANNGIQEGTVLADQIAFRMQQKNNALECPHCRKEYKRKDFYRKHVLLCGMLSSTDRSMDDFDDTPDIRNLYTIVQELGHRVEEYKKECGALRKRVTLLEKMGMKSCHGTCGENGCSIQTNNQVLVLDPWAYLEKHKTCEQDIESWVEGLQFDAEDVIQFSNQCCLDAICNIIEKYHHYNVPLCAFRHQNKNLIMMFRGNHWEECRMERKKWMLDTISQNILIQVSCGSVNVHDPHIVSQMMLKITEKTYNENSYMDFHHKLFQKIQQEVA